MKKSVRRALMVGFTVGCVLVFGLVVLNGMTLSSAAAGISEQHFLGLTVARAAKEIQNGGGSTVTMSPTFWMLVPLLAPAALLAGIAAVTRRVRAVPA